MLRRVRPWVGAVIVTVAVSAVGCTTPAGPMAVTSPAAPSSTSASTPAGPAQPSSSSPRPAGSSTASASPSADPSAVTVAITIADGKVEPSGQRVDVTKGQTVIFTVTSDIDDEIHVHTAGDGMEIVVRAGKPTTERVVASDTGTFEVESHHLSKTIVRLTVR